MSDRSHHVVDFYSRHPISAEHILAKLRDLRGHLDDLKPDELFAHDQDHYGGLAVNDMIAQRAGIGAGTKVADFCAGLGGPARYMAFRHGADVTGIDLNPQRVAGGNELTRRVGLSERVRLVNSDVTRTPLPADTFDVVMSQEALLHVPDKSAAIAEAHRILKPGGRLCFTDWIEHRPLTNDEAETLWRGIAAQTIQNEDSYCRMLEARGFRVDRFDDLTGDWGEILQQRLAMYRALREETLAAGMPAGDEEFYSAYVQLVALVKSRALGGARFTAVK